MWRCPICAKQQNSNPTICRECGFDSSSDMEIYPTLMRADVTERSTVQGIIQARKAEQDSKYLRLEQRMAEFERRIEQLELRLTLAEEKRESIPPARQEKALSEENVRRTLVPGDTIVFGMYKQGKNGERRPIEWIVLEIAAGKALLMSRYALEFRQYHGHNEAVTWESSDIRLWLNDIFLRDAFTEVECGRIVYHRIEVPRYQYLAIEGGAPTNDRIFLLSGDEIKKYFPDRRSRLLKGTDWTEWVKAHNEGSRFKKNCWWTRAPGFKNDHAVFVDEKGELDTIGCRVASYKMGVYPALWVSLEK